MGSPQESRVFFGQLAIENERTKATWRIRPIIESKRPGEAKKNGPDAEKDRPRVAGRKSSKQAGIRAGVGASFCASPGRAGLAAWGCDAAEPGC